MEAHERRALPEGWEWKRLGNVAKYINGRAFKPTEWSNSGKPIIRIQNLTDESNSFNYFDGECEQEYCIKNGDILISWSASLGVFVWNRGDSVLNQHIFKAILNEKIIDKRFFVFVIRTVMEDMERKTHGSTMKHIVKSEFNNIKIPLPPLPTQRRIVSILEKAEETKRLRTQADELTDRLRQSVFLEMFGDPVKNPKGWEKYKFKDVIQEFRYGTSVKSSEGGYPVLRIPNVIDGKINLNELKYCKVTLDEYEKLRLQEGDVLFVRTNGNQDYVGRCAVVEKIQKDFIFASYLIRAKLKQEIISPYYLKNYLFTGHGKNLIKSKTKTTAGQFNINTQGLGSVDIFVPPLPLQQKFARIVEKVESMRQTQAQSKLQIEDLFSALMQKAFKGELET